jgi:hypothetical protein
MAYEIDLISRAQSGALAASILDAHVVCARGSITAVRAYVRNMTDADDSARIDVQKNGVSILSSTINPTDATPTTGELASDNIPIVPGDLLTLNVTQGSDDSSNVIVVTLLVDDQYKGGSIGSSTDAQPTYTEYTFTDGTVRKDYK